MATGTKKTKRKPVRESSEPEPTWEIARLFPPQGEWSEEEFFALPSNHKIEFSNGYLEFLPMPTIYHQLILQYIYEELKPFVKAGKLGIVVITGYKVRVPHGKYREPDILFIKDRAHVGDFVSSIARRSIWSSKSSARRTAYTTSKPSGGIRPAGIPEYWIVDPEEETITVLVLKPRRKTYVEHGRFAKGMRATSKLLPGFSVDVTTALSQKPEIAEVDPDTRNHESGICSRRATKLPRSASNSTTATEPSGVAPTLMTILPSLSVRSCGHVQMPAEMEPGHDRLVGIEEAALAAMATRGGEVGQADRAGVGDQDVDRAGLGDPGRRIRDVGIGDIVPLGVRLRPDPADRRQAQARDLGRVALGQQDRRIIPVPQAGQQVDRIVIAEGRVRRARPRARPRTWTHPPHRGHPNRRKRGSGRARTRSQRAGPSPDRRASR